MRTFLVFCVLQVTLSYNTDPNFKDPASMQLVKYSEEHRETSQLVTNYGYPIDDISTVLTAGERGPLLVQDIVFFERLAHLARERIPERVVHAKGAGAFGQFNVTNVTQYTKAKFLSQLHKVTDVTVRFSTATGSKGSADTVRDLRGFAVKFYTEDGILDFLTLATPTFFIRDPMQFPQLTHAIKNNPATNLKDFNMFWDFMTQRPETLLQLLFLYGEDGIPNCYRCINGFAGNTYILHNDKDEVFLAKFMLKLIPPKDIKCTGLTNKQAASLSGTDPDYCVRDLYNAIEKTYYPKWRFGIQVMTLEESTRIKFNPYDVTKLWQENQYPFIELGKLVLNRNPDNFFEQVEQITFNPGRLVPGIELSVDRVLQGRMFIYGDTQRYRIGPNFEQMKINRPGSVRVTNYERDGPQPFGNQGGSPNYYPNIFNGPQPDPKNTIAKYNVTGYVMRYPDWNIDNFKEPGLLYMNLNDKHKKRTVENLACDIKKAIPCLQERAVALFYNVSSDLGDRLRNILEDDNYHFSDC